MNAHTIHFERLSAREGMTPQDPPRARIIGPYDARVMAFIRELPAHERAFDAEHQAWRVSLTGPARLSRLARVVNGLEAVSVSPAMTAPEVAEAVTEYSRRLAPLAAQAREQNAAATFSVKTQADSVLLCFDYHRGWNAALRALPGGMRTFDPQHKGWRVARESEALNRLAETAREAGFPGEIQHTLDALANEGRQTSGEGEPGMSVRASAKNRSAPSMG